MSGMMLKKCCCGGGNGNDPIEPWACCATIEAANLFPCIPPQVGERPTGAFITSTLNLLSSGTFAGTPNPDPSLGCDLLPDTCVSISQSQSESVTSQEIFVGVDCSYSRLQVHPQQVVDAGGCLQVVETRASSTVFYAIGGVNPGLRIVVSFQAGLRWRALNSGNGTPLVYLARLVGSSEYLVSSAGVLTAASGFPGGNYSVFNQNGSTLYTLPTTPTIAATPVSLNCTAWSFRFDFSMSADGTLAPYYANSLACIGNAFSSLSGSIVVSSVGMGRCFNPTFLASVRNADPSMMAAVQRQLGGCRGCGDPGVGDLA